MPRPNEAWFIAAAVLLAAWTCAARAQEVAVVEHVQVTVVHEFHHPWRGLEGAEPGTVTIGRDGNLYGTTALGGTYGAGTVFRIKPDGAFETLHVFKGPDGFRPDACLLSAADGVLYGTTGREFDAARSSVFRVTPEGSVQTLAVLYASPRAIEERHTVFIRGSDDHLYGLDNFTPSSLTLRWHKDFAPPGPVFQVVPERRHTQNIAAAGAPAPSPMKKLIPTDSNPLCGNSMAADDGHVWGASYGYAPFGKSRSTDPIDGMDPPVKVYLEAPGTARTPTQNPDYKIAGGGFGRPAQTPDATILATSSYAEGGQPQFAVIGISAQGIVVSRTSLNVFSSRGRPMFGLVAGRDGYFYGLIQGWGRSGGQEAPSLMYRLRPGGPLEQVQVFAGAVHEPMLAGPIVPGPGDGTFYVTFRNAGAHHQGVIYRISVPH